MTQANTNTAERGTAPNTSSVSVELANRATVGTRIAHAALFGTVRTGLAVAAHFGDALPVSPAWAFAISSYTDAFATALLPPRGTRRDLVRFDKFRAEWLWDKHTPDPATEQDCAILYFHGGGYVWGGLNTHRRLAAKIGGASGMPVFNVDYRQLPKAHFTDTLDDAVASYRYLLSMGFPPERIIVSGDSAGGGLAVRLALATKERGLPMPGAISVISPWADLDWTTRNAHPNSRRDSVIPPIGPEVVARWCYTVDGKLDPMWSAVNHDFTGMPPSLIQVGSAECLLSDAEQLARRYDEANAPLHLQIWDTAPHVHHAASDILADARTAIHDMAAFNRQMVGAAGLPYRKVFEPRRLG